MTLKPIVVVGPTAVGKSSLAFELARQLGNVELISADSMQVYRGMDIGTAKATAEEQAEVSHHLIDVVDVHEEFNVSDFQLLARDALAQIAHRGNRAIIVGGTGLYVRSIIDDLDIPGRYPEVRQRLSERTDLRLMFAELSALDPAAAARMDPANRRRVERALEVTLGSGRPFSSFGPGMETYPEVPFIQVGIDAERPLLDRRIHDRYDTQMERGFLDEVASVLDHPQGMFRTARQALGYKELIDHFEHGTPVEDCLDTARQRTRRFARRQQKWFRRDPRICWFPVDEQGSSANSLRIATAVLRDCLT